MLTTQNNKKCTADTVLTTQTINRNVTNTHNTNRKALQIGTDHIRHVEGIRKLMNMAGTCLSMSSLKGEIFVYVNILII